MKQLGRLINKTVDTEQTINKWITWLDHMTNRESDENKEQDTHRDMDIIC